MTGKRRQSEKVAITTACPACTSISGPYDYEAKHDGAENVLFRLLLPVLPLFSTIADQQTLSVASQHTQSAAAASQPPSHAKRLPK